MYRCINDCLEHDKELVESTSKLFGEIPDDSLKQRPADGYRSLGSVAWHIVVTVPEMMNRTGLKLSSVNEKAPPPSSAAEIVGAYAQVSSELLEAVKENWSDTTLTEIDELYGEKWPRGKTLTALVHHEIHHRGQITTMLRQAGNKVPGLYGPSKEEWKQYGMDEPPY